MDKPPPTRDAGTADAGVTQSSVVKERRAAFKARMDRAAVTIGKAKHGTVTVSKMLWSTGFASDNEKDSVLVLMNTPDGEVGLMFILSDGTWDSLPDDFRP